MNRTGSHSLLPPAQARVARPPHGGLAARRRVPLRLPRPRPRVRPGRAVRVRRRRARHRLERHRAPRRALPQEVRRGARAHRRAALRRLRSRCSSAPARAASATPCSSWPASSRCSRPATATAPASGTPRPHTHLVREPVRGRTAIIETAADAARRSRCRRSTPAARSTSTGSASSTPSRATASCCGSATSRRARCRAPGPALRRRYQMIGVRVEDPWERVLPRARPHHRRRSDHRRAAALRSRARPRAARRHAEWVRARDAYWHAALPVAARRPHRRHRRRSARRADPLLPRPHAGGEAMSRSPAGPSPIPPGCSLLLALPAIAWLRARRGRPVLVIPFVSRWAGRDVVPRSRLPLVLVERRPRPARRRPGAPAARRREAPGAPEGLRHRPRHRPLRQHAGRGLRARRRAHQPPAGDQADHRRLHRRAARATASASSPSAAAPTRWRRSPPTTTGCTARSSGSRSA